jgi:hypothetical protein
MDPARSRATNNLLHGMHNLKGVCALRGPWRSMLCKLTHPCVTGVPCQQPHNAARHSSSMWQRADTLPLQAA